MPEPTQTPIWARPDKKKPGRLSTVVGIVVVIVVAVLIGIALTLLNKSQQGGAAGGAGGGRRQPVTVGVAKAVTGQIPITLDALGSVTPPVTATITSRIAGNLMAVNFTEGQMVRKGQTLAQVDPRPYRVALEQAQATMQHDQALLANAQLDLKRYQTLLKQNSISGQTVDTQAATVKQDQAQVAADQASVDSAKLNLDYTTITAPVAGRVGLRQVDVGNYVTAGSSTGIVVITVINPMDVEFAIPEDNIPRILRRQANGASLVATALNRDGGQELAVGALSTLDTQIDSTTGTVKAKARFDNSNMTLFPQQFVNIHLLVDTLCNQVVVPTTAVRHGASGDYVYAVQPDKTAKVMYVRTGPGTPETVSVQQGLTPGTTVVTDGGDRLRDGSPVLLPGDNPQVFQQAQQRFSQHGGQSAGAGGQGGGHGGQSGQHRFGGHGGHGGRGGAFNGPGGAPPPPGLTPTTTAAEQEERDIAAGSCDAAGQHGQGHGRFGGQAPGADQGQGQGQGWGGFHHHGQNGRGPQGQDGQGQGSQTQSSQTQGAQTGGGQGPNGQGGWRRRHGQGQGSGQGDTANGPAA